MNSFIAEQKQAKDIERIAGALERIANGVERYADADPMTVLHEAMQGAETAGDVPLDQAPWQEPREWWSSNGHTFVYKHPDPQFEIVLRRDPSAVSGYAAMIERS